MKPARRHGILAPMSRSLFAKLHRRFGRRVSGAELQRRAAVHRERLHAAMPIDLIGGGPRLAASRSARVVVIGGGFAGLSAAWFAARAGMAVTVIEPRTPGGRVSSTRTLVEGRILEAGAELIGVNHPMWLAFSRHFGMAMSMLSGEEEYAAVGLSMPMIIDGKHLSAEDQKRVHDEMDRVFHGWAEDARVVKEPWTPWMTADAEKLDAETLESHIPHDVSELTAAALRFHFEQDNTTPASGQSWLGTLAQIAGGGGYGFFEDTEVFRCAAGNQSLATHLAAHLNIDRHRVTNIRSGPPIMVDLDGGEREGPFDFAVVAVPSVAMEKLTVDGKPFPYRAIHHGPAVKYLSGVEHRFWIEQGIAPSGMSDQLGMIWEGTDNQMDTGRFDISVFAGGRNAKAAMDAGGGAAYFAPRLTAVFPNYHPFRTEFENWPRRAGMGYSCPAPGDVTGTQKSYAALIDGRIAVAGEHTSPPWFGYMEGALQSGLVAAVRIAAAAGVNMPPEWGTFRAV